MTDHVRLISRLHFRLVWRGDMLGDMLEKGELSRLMEWGVNPGLRARDGGPATQAPWTFPVVCQLSTTLNEEMEEIEEVRECVLLEGEVLFA